MQQLQRQISSEQTNDIHTSVTRSSDKQIPEKSLSNKVPLNEEQANNVQRSVTQSLDKQIPEKSISNKEQANDVQRSVTRSSDKQIPEKSISNKEANDIRKSMIQSADKQISKKLSLFKAFGKPVTVPFISISKTFQPISKNSKNIEKIFQLHNQISPNRGNVQRSDSHQIADFRKISFN